jgi:drug/metabolite transporter (DMT)-like permease
MTDLLIGHTQGQYVGEMAALTAAFLWAAATLMFGALGRQLSPLVLNAVKGIFAMGFIVMTLTVRQATSEASVNLLHLPVQATAYLLLSGVVGIGLGDTAYFGAINTLGARRSLLLETLAPPVTAVLAWAFLAEKLSVISILGIGIILIGIAWVISEQVPGHEPVKWGAGLKVALLAVVCQAAGAVLSRAALADSAVDPLWSTLLRLSAGLAFMGVLAVIQPHRLGEHLSLSALKRPSLLGGVALAAFFGTYLGIWLQQIALKYTAAGIAQALLATSPLFVLPMAAVLGDRISLRSTLGAAIALGGVWILLAD